MSGVKLLDHWAPPDGSGAPVACLATTFTLEADFFTQDCLSRFLRLSTLSGEGDNISSIAATLEEENGLSEAQVSVLVDRRSPAEKRNLRWDLLPVHIPGGLLHAKVAVLIWERSARIILGSANLTSAGYRRQVEVALAIDLDHGCTVPRSVVDDLVTELRHVVDRVHGGDTGPKQRAMAIVDRLAERGRSLDLPTTSTRDLRLAVAPARPGVNPLDRLPEVWRGSQPLQATVLSPYWDDTTPAPAVQAIHRLLTGRPASRRALTLVADVDHYTGRVLAPPSLAAQPGATVVAFDPPDDEPRSLHAKVLLVESDDWLAAMLGSSNATEAGLGLSGTRGHEELNLWFGCPAASHTAGQLRALARPGEQISFDDASWVPEADEDEPTTPELPLGFVSCTIDARARRLQLTFDPAALPPSWSVTTAAGSPLLDADTWQGWAAPEQCQVDLPDEPLPAYLDVHWDAEDGRCQATWTANVEDRSALPPPADLAQLPPDLVLAILASTRPLPVALERELRRRDRVDGESSPVELDALRRFDDSGLLLQRTRHRSLALWRLQERLSLPASSIDAIHWRLTGAVGPLAIARGLVAAAEDEDQAILPGEAHFLLAELALTIAQVDWPQGAPTINAEILNRIITEVIAELESCRRLLPPAPHSSLDAYLNDALAKAAP